MNIYVVTFYNLVDGVFYDYRHKNFQHLKDAKEYVKTFIQDFKRIFEDDNPHVMEHDYEKDNRLYLAYLDHDNSFNETIREKIDISKEQVY